jgi:hypothetical protein
MPANPPPSKTPSAEIKPPAPLPYEAASGAIPPTTPPSDTRSPGTTTRKESDRPPDTEPDWEDLTRGQPFVTDLGFEPNYLQPMPSGPPMIMGRYAVFVPVEGQARHQIAEVSGDLDYLKQKYGVPESLV